MRKNIKKILYVISSILGALCLFAICIMGLRIYRINNHGYNSSETVIKKYIDAYASQNMYDIEQCLNADSKSYQTLLEEINNNFTSSDTNPFNQLIIDEIIVSQTDISDDIKNHVKTNIGLANMSDIQLNNVIIKTTQNINNIDYIYDYHYLFTTYCVNNKWFIDSFNCDAIKYVGRKDGLIIDDVIIGSDELGYINVPGDWVDNTGNINQDDAIQKVSSISPDNNSMITMSILPTITTIEKIEGLIIQQFVEQNYTYTINTHESLGGIACRAIIGLDSTGETTQIIYLFANPLKDSYIHSIELICFADEATHYCNNYIKTYQLKNMAK